MSAFPSQAARKQAQNVTRFLPARPHESLARLPQIECNAIANALDQTSNNSNGVGTLGIGADVGYNQQPMQDIINKVDELINALRR
jgi:hypothetical protein